MGTRRFCYEVCGILSCGFEDRVESDEDEDQQGKVSEDKEFDK